MLWLSLYLAIGLIVMGFMLKFKQAGFRAYLTDPSFRHPGQWHDLVINFFLSLLVGVFWGPGLLMLLAGAVSMHFEKRGLPDIPASSPAKRASILDGQPLPDSTLDCRTRNRPGPEQPPELYYEMALTLEIMQTAPYRYWSYIALSVRYQQQDEASNVSVALASLETAGLVELYKEYLTPEGCQSLNFTDTDTPDRHWYRLTDKGRTTPPRRGQQSKQGRSWTRGSRTRPAF